MLRKYVMYKSHASVILVDWTGHVGQSAEKDTCVEFRLINILETGYLEYQIRDIGFEDGRWTDVIQDHIRWRTWLLALLDLEFLLPESHFNNESTFEVGLIENLKDKLTGNAENYKNELYVISFR